MDKGHKSTKPLFDEYTLIAFVSAEGVPIYNNWAFEIPRLRKKIKRWISNTQAPTKQPSED